MQESIPTATATGGEEWGGVKKGLGGPWIIFDSRALDTRWQLGRNGNLPKRKCQGLQLGSRRGTGRGKKGNRKCNRLYLGSWTRIGRDKRGNRCNMNNRWRLTRNRGVQNKLG